MNELLSDLQGKLTEQNEETVKNIKKLLKEEVIEQTERPLYDIKINKPVLSKVAKEKLGEIAETKGKVKTEIEKVKQKIKGIQGQSVDFANLKAKLNAISINDGDDMDKVIEKANEFIQALDGYKPAIDEKDFYNLNIQTDTLKKLTEDLENFRTI